MAEKRARLDLARAAAALAAGYCPTLPSLVLMTDDERLADPLAAARAMPRGSMVIVRAREPSHRTSLAEQILAIARARGLKTLIANDPRLAARLGADGIHLPQSHAREAGHWRALHPRWLITVSSHGGTLVPNAADAVLLSAIFTTPSRRSLLRLGPLKASFIAMQMSKPVYALGGITARNATRLSSAFAGIAAIGSLTV